ncbi:MAG: hypothetical protein ACLFOY_12485 [Desulfatibacillaceae bacterium]
MIRQLLATALIVAITATPALCTEPLTDQELDCVAGSISTANIFSREVQEYAMARRSGEEIRALASEEAAVSRLLKGADMSLELKDRFTLVGESDQGTLKVYSLDDKPLLNRDLARDLNQAYLVVDETTGAMPRGADYDQIRSGLESIEAFFGPRRRIGFEYLGNVPRERSRGARGWIVETEVTGVTAKGVVTVH